MKKSLFAALLLSLLGSFGCGTEFDPGSRVTTFRVLAMQADAPFAKPGEAVKLHALSFDPEGRDVTWAWLTCVNPSASTVESCFEKVAADAAASGDSPIVAQGVGMDSFSLTVPEDALSSLPAVARSSALVGVLSVACPGDLTFDARAQPAPFHCKDVATGRELGGDEYVIGLKRIIVRESDRNQNPSIEGITFDSEPWPENEVKTVTACNTDSNDYDKCAGHSKHQLAAQLSADSVEAGTAEDGEAFTEQLIIEYYGSGGNFEHEIKISADPQTGWAARKSDAGKDLTLWFVAHDDRGGQSWTERTVHVQ